MIPGGRAARLSGALLLLWLPGSFPLLGPSNVTGMEGRSLSVQCQYEEQFQANSKYWCRKSLLLLCEKIVETTDSQRVVRSGRVSISDHPENLTFTVTLERLSLEDAGAYRCGVDTPWHKGFDPAVQVTVSVLPAPTSGTPTDEAKTSTPRARVTSALPTSLAAESVTHGSTSQEDRHQGQGLRLSVLLSLLVLLLLLLTGSSLLAWRMLKKVRGQPSELSQNLGQAVEHGELQYANLQLQQWSRREHPAPPRQEEVEYSLVGPPREELHYSCVVFEPQKMNSSNANGIASQGQKEEPEYSLICKPGHGGSPQDP